MGGKVGNYLNPVTAFKGATTDALKQGKILASGKGKLSNFVTGADDIGSLGLGNDVGVTKAVFGNGNSSPVNPAYSIDPAQSASDQAAINALGQQEYNQTLQQIPADVGNAVNQELPGIEETLNSQHLLNSTELPHQIAQQQEYLTQNLAVPAQQNLQSFQTGALQRGLSLEDFNNQAAVAKSIGATVAPQVGNGKGTAVSGLGSGAAAGTAVMPGWGTAIGAGLGYIAGGGLGGGSTTSASGAKSGK